VVADSGYGKTRLVHEFYSIITKEENPHGGGEGYWPDQISIKPDNVEINPDFAGKQDTQAMMPWLWWGIRWTDIGARNAQGNGGTPIVLY